ncbi:MAG: hypothetical protein J6J36_05055 [Clostridia bacterium]|nr:hypothetical protein [Clostridia bacterium]
MKKLTTLDFITKSAQIHNHKYDYSKVVYKNNITEVCIICPEHGEFWQKPVYHMGGSVCPQCAKEKSKILRTKLKEDFIRDAINKHGHKYDYSKAEYINNYTKICIICPEHGEFWQKPINHLNGQGCPLCGGTKKMTSLEFIERSNDIHKSKYDYSKVNYEKYEKKVCIICHEKDEFGEEHGEFWQTPHHHLNGCGCKKCSKNYMDTDMFIKKSKYIHNNKYDYSKTEYINSQNKVCIICPEHGEFWQTPSEHLNGAGCPKCKGTHFEKIIMSELETYGIKYEFQKTFEWLKYKNFLYLDFYLPEKQCAIEFQGEQHFKIVNFGNKTEKEMLNELKRIQKRDARKLCLCEQNGIKIHYINYTEKDNIKEKIKEIIDGTTC